MTRWHHDVFRAMPVGRLLLAREVYQRANLPAGWTLGDVREALKEFERQGAVKVEKIGIGGTKTINGYMRLP
jgi:hypothetical protein